jgi:hypothetical protein
VPCLECNVLIFAKKTFTSPYDVGDPMSKKLFLSKDPYRPLSNHAGET